MTEPPADDALDTLAHLARDDDAVVRGAAFAALSVALALLRHRAMTTPTSHSPPPR
ncbi:hypothetical protein [Streptomyces sp. NPDC000229]|uniref:hypothetical protein n=1 Tax=Streptomyces sp. NPDC000229 TaxID=3154247 RepID=UPI00332D3398